MPAPLPLLDTNPILRHVVGDHADHSPRAHALMKRIESGDERVRTTDTVIFEVVYTLEKFYSASRPEIRDALSDILSLPGILLPRKDSYRRVFELWVSHPRLSFADCYHAALVERLSLPAIISFDRGFDAITSIVRREP